VYQFSVIVSILCLNTQHLGLSLSKLVDYVYLNPGHTNYPSWDGPNYVVMIKLLVQNDIHGSETFLDESLSHFSVFYCLWLLESLTSERPEHLHEYLQRRTLLLQRQADQLCLIKEEHLQFVHKAYLAVLRSSYVDLLFIMKDSSVHNHWPRMLALRLCPKLRKQAFTIMYKAYLQIPLRKSMVDLVRQEASESIVARNQASIDWLDSMVFLNDQISADVQILWWLGSGFNHKHWSDTIAYVAPRIRGAADAHVLAWRP